jgi:hypothetical protein
VDERRGRRGGQGVGRGRGEGEEEKLRKYIQGKAVKLSSFRDDHPCRESEKLPKYINKTLNLGSNYIASLQDTNNFYI